MRWELVPYQNNPMSLVRVRDSSKRVRVPVVLTIEQFQQVLLHIPEPYHTMCAVAGCLGLRISGFAMARLRVGETPSANPAVLGLCPDWRAQDRKFEEANAA